MKIVIDFSTDGASFDEDFYGEAERVLSSVMEKVRRANSQRIMNQHCGSKSLKVKASEVKHKIMDANGNSIGTVSIKV